MNICAEYKESMYLIFKHKNLIIELGKQDISDKYVGQVFGKAWALVHPGLIMGVYMFMFVFVFNLKIQVSNGISIDFDIYLISGLVAWLVMMELLAKSTVAVTSNANMVKQVIFQLEILPLKTVFSTFLTMGMFVAILLIDVVLYKRNVSLIIFLLPILLYMQVIMMIGIAYILSSIGVYFRDIKDIVQMLGTVGAFMLPIMYHPSQLPLFAQIIIYVNPFSYLVFCYQDIFAYGCFEHWYAWIVLFLLSHIIFIFGFYFFKKLKIMFGDVL